MARNGIDIERYRWDSPESRSIVLTNLSKTGPGKIAEMHDSLFPRDPVNKQDRLHARTDALVSHLQTVVTRAIAEAIDETRSMQQSLILEIGAGDGDIIRGLLGKLTAGMRSSIRAMALDPYHKTRVENGIFYVNGSVRDYAKDLNKRNPAMVVINTADPHHSGTEEDISAHILADATFVGQGGRLVLTDTVHGEDFTSWRRDFETTISCHDDKDKMEPNLPRAREYLTASKIRSLILASGMTIEEELARSPSIGAREYHHTFLARKPIS